MFPDGVTNPARPGARRNREPDGEEDVGVEPPPVTVVCVEPGAPWVAAVGVLERLSGLVDPPHAPASSNRPTARHDAVEYFRTGVMVSSTTSGLLDPDRLSRRSVEGPPRAVPAARNRRGRQRSHSTVAGSLFEAD